MPVSEPRVFIVLELQGGRPLQDSNVEIKCQEEKDRKLGNPVAHEWKD